MAKRMKLATEVTDDMEAPKIGREWGDLDYDLLHQILSLLPVEDLIRSIPLVCHDWKIVCGTLLFWKDYETLDLRPLKILFCYLSSTNIHENDLHMNRLLKFALNWKTREHHLRCVKTIIFSPSMCLNDNHLAFLAERSPGLKKLILSEARDINLKDFLRIMQTWRELEELSIASLEHDYWNCFCLDEKKASIIAKNLPKLRVLTIEKAKLNRSGLRTLLSESKSLVELNIKLCQGENISEGSTLRFLKKKNIRGDQKLQAE